jgi:hypothetical protein
MAMKKAEMEGHSTAYGAKLEAARHAEDRGLYRPAVEAAMSSWEHIDGMLQYAARYENREFSSIAAIDLVLEYAPLLLDARTLNAVEAFLDTCKRIHRKTSEDLPAKVDAARGRIRDNHRLWGHIQRNGDVRQDELRQTLGGDQNHWRDVAQAWAKMGLVSRAAVGNSYQLSLSTRMGEVVRAKCPSCGHIDQAPKGMFLEKIRCPQCREKRPFRSPAMSAIEGGSNHVLRYFVPGWSCGRGRLFLRGREAVVRPNQSA